MRNREMETPAVSGFSPEAREQMRQAAPRRQERWRKQVDAAIEAMAQANAAEMLQSVRDRVAFYFDRDLAAADLQRAVDRYREVTGRRAPRRLTQLA